MQDGAAIDIDVSDAEIAITLRGDFTVAQVTDLYARLDDVAADRPARVDMSAVERLDTAGAWALGGFRQRLEAAGQSLSIEGASEEQASLMETVAEAWPVPDDEPAKPRTIADRLEAVGRAMAAAATS